MNLVCLTAYKGSPEDFKPLYRSVLPQLEKNDIWIIVIDGVELKDFEIFRQTNVMLFGFNSAGKAGLSRNFGLEKLSEQDIRNFVILPIDGDDRMKSGALSFVKEYFISTGSQFVVFGQERLWADGKVTLRAYEGTFAYTDQLFNYRMPLGATAVFINDKTELKQYRFGKRKRANDQGFFLSALRAKGFGHFTPKVIHEYQLNPTSLSSKKWKMIFYKIMSLYDIGVPFVTIARILPKYIIRGILRQFWRMDV